MEIFYYLIELLVFSFIIFFIGIFSLSFFKGTHSKINGSSIATIGSIVLVLVVSIIITRGATFNLSIWLIGSIYLFLYKKICIPLLPKKEIIKIYFARFLEFVLYLIISFAITLFFLKTKGYAIQTSPSFYDSYFYHGVATYLIEQHAENKYFFWNFLESIGPYSYHYFDSWLEVFSIKLFSNSSFNNYQLIVLPFLLAIIFQSIADCFDVEFKQKSGKIIVFLLVCLLICSCGQSSLFNNFPFLSYLPTPRSYILFSPTSNKLFIVYILLFQAFFEFKNNNFTTPLSLLILPLIYPTALPLVFVYLGIMFLLSVINKKHLQLVPLVIFGFIIVVSSIILLKLSFSEDIISAPFNQKPFIFSSLGILKYFVVSIIQVSFLSWLLFIFVGVTIFYFGFKNWLNKYQFWIQLYFPVFFVGALIFPYCKQFGFDMDQFYFNFMIPLLSVSIVYFAVESIQIKSVKSKSIIWIIFPLLIASKLNFATAQNSWKYYRPAYYEMISQEFVSAITNRLNAIPNKNKGISICSKDTLHWSYSPQTKIEAWQLSNNWITCYANKTIFPSNFSRFYFCKDGMELLSNKKYFDEFRKKNRTAFSNRDNQLSFFLQQCKMDYLITDVQLGKEILSNFSDSLIDKQSGLKVYFSN